MGLSGASVLLCMSMCLHPVDSLDTHIVCVSLCVSLCIYIHGAIAPTVCASMHGPCLVYNTELPCLHASVLHTGSMLQDITALSTL